MLKNKKMDLMKRILITLLIIMTISLKAYTQDSLNVEIIGDNRPYTEIFDTWFRNIRYDTLSTKILYDRVVPFADLENKNGYSNDTLDKTDFIQAYSELHRASSSDMKVFSMNVENLRDNINLSSNDSTIQLGIIYSDFSIIDTNSFYDGRLLIIDSTVYVNDTNTRNIFINKNTFLSSALSKTLYNNLSITFNLNNLFMFNNTNKDINKIMIDYDNGQGFVSYNISNGIMITENINYLDYGNKIVTIKIITSSNDTLTSKSKINLLQTSKTSLYYVEHEVYADEPFESIYGKGEVRIYYSNSDTILRKPILIVDGFDPLDTRRFDHDIADDSADNKGGIWGLLKYVNNSDTIHLGEELLEKGYDIVILNFPFYTTYNINGNTEYIFGGADAIQRNAKVCEKVINTLNLMLKNNGSQEQLVVIGPSMGGQITRYALKTMENNIGNYDYRGHNTRLWVSLDSPHQGANIPLSVQHFLYFFGYQCGNEYARHNYLNNFQSVAAIQMLIHHIQLSLSLYTSYYNEINQLGFPDLLRKVAIANGSLNGTLTGCPKLLTLDAYSLFNKNIAKLRMLANGGDKVRVFYGYHPKYSLLKPYEVFVKTPSGQCSYDAAPGGKLGSFYAIAKTLVKMKFHGLPLVAPYLNESYHCFIPTKSALAYDKTITNNANLCEDLFQNWNRDLVAEGVIPFDNYWGPINANMEHVTFNKWLHEWFNKELDTYIQGERELNLCGTYQYVISNYQQGTNIEWTCSNNLQIVSAPNSPTLSIKALSQGNGWVRANVSSLDHRKDLGYYTVIVNEGNVIAANKTTGNTTWNTDLNIGTDFTVKTGHTLTIQNAKISIAPDIKIKIEPGAKLIIDNSTLTSYCQGNYWGGIEVYGQRDLSQTKENQGYLTIKNHSVIENARNAVSLWKSGDWSSTGGIVNISNSTFKNNIRSFEFLSYKNKNQNDIEINNIGLLANCTFIWDSNMFEHNKTSLNHITLWDVKGVQFIACNFKNETTKDDILKNGIYSQGAGFIVRGRDNILGITKSTFTNLDYGVRAENTTKTLTVQNSDFDNNFCGIFNIASNNTKILNNEFKINPVLNPRGLFESDAAFGLVLHNTQVI